MSQRLAHTLWNRNEYRGMTVEDPVSGRKTTRCHAIEHDRWMVNPNDPDYLDPGDRWCRVCGYADSEHRACGRCKLAFVVAPA